MQKVFAVAFTAGVAFLISVGLTALFIFAYLILGALGVILVVLFGFVLLALGICAHREGWG